MKFLSAILIGSVSSYANVQFEHDFNLIKHYQLSKDGPNNYSSKSCYKYNRKWWKAINLPDKPIRSPCGAKKCEPC